MDNENSNVMDFVANLIERLRNASTSELPRIRADYEAYLVNLTADEQTRIIDQINPVLRELAGQSINRLEESAATYLTRHKGQITA